MARDDRRVLKEYRTLLPFLRRYRMWYLGGVLALIVTSGAQLMIPQFIRHAIDMIAGGDFELNAIARTMLLMVATAFVIAIGRLGWRFFIHGASRRIEKELREKLFDHLLKLSPSFFGRNKTGDIMARATNDMDAVRMASGMAFVAFVDGLFLTIAILAILFTQQARLTLVTIIPLPLITIMILFFGRVIGKLFKGVQEGFSRLSEQSRETLTGIRVVQSFVREDYFRDRFMAANADYQAKNLQLVRIWGLFFPLVHFLAGITGLILLRFGGELVITGTLSPGEFVATMSYLEMLIWPMLGAGFTVNMFQRGGASLARINAILDEAPEITSAPDAVASPETPSIEFRSLTFTYPGADTPALDDISFSLPAGGLLGILGHTGSGKSTLLTLLPRMIDPPEGTVFVGGRDVRQYRLDGLRRAFGFVPQDTFLFSDSLEHNVLFAVRASDEAVRGAIVTRVGAVSAVGRDIENFPNGWKTEIGERGITLSGGQKQRIAISRALAVDPSILVLDDALSAVDTETEEKILRALLPERKGKTTIVVSHRISTLQHADLIVVLRDGRIIQSGNHAELVNLDGYYREIFELQQLESRRARDE